MATLREHTHAVVVAQLVNSGFNQSVAAGELGISRGCLHMILVEALGVPTGFAKEILKRHDFSLGKTL